jgi:mRNA interferase MazF
MPTSEYPPFTVVSVPFPFTDTHQTRRRPALVLSASDFNRQAGHLVLAMITSARHSAWPLDSLVSDLTSAGLRSPSLVRMKLFTLDSRLILKKLGQLAQQDATQVIGSLMRLFEQSLRWRP